LIFRIYRRSVAPFQSSLLDVLFLRYSTVPPLSSAQHLIRPSCFHDLAVQTQVARAYFLAPVLYSVGLLLTCCCYTAAAVLHVYCSHVATADAISSALLLLRMLRIYRTHATASADAILCMLLATSLWCLLSACIGSCPCGSASSMQLMLVLLPSCSSCSCSAHAVIMQCSCSAHRENNLFSAFSIRNTTSPILKVSTVQPGTHLPCTQGALSVSIKSSQAFICALSTEEFVCVSIAPLLDCLLNSCSGNGIHFFNTLSIH
jgi:hypothetical protein